MTPTEASVDTPRGPARLHVTRAGDDWLLLGHGAGGSSWSVDLRAAADAATSIGWSVAMVDQPWRVAGRRVADRPPVLDEAWVPIVAEVRRQFAPRRLVCGGRSAGARVACRTASVVGADGVLCMAFPLHPPGRPESSRAEELALPVRAGMPLRVIQGQRDPFGTPAELSEVIDPSLVVAVPGTHSIAAAAQVRTLTGDWLVGLGGE